MVELQDGFQSFCIEVIIVTSAHISLVKASHMAKLDGNRMGNMTFFFREEQIVWNNYIISHNLFHVWQEKSLSSNTMGQITSSQTQLTFRT